MGFATLYLIFFPFLIYGFTSVDHSIWDILVSPVFISNLPFLSIVFIISVFGKIKKFLKTQKAIVPEEIEHSYFYGNSKYFQSLKGFAFNGYTITEDTLRNNFEPYIISIVSIIVLWLDPILGIYLLAASLLMRFENWYENHTRFNAVLDIIDGLIDAKYYQFMVSKLKQVNSNEADYQALFNSLNKESTTTHDKLDNSSEELDSDEFQNLI